MAANSAVAPSWRTTRSWATGGIGQQQSGVGRRVHVGEAEDKTVVGGHGFHVRPACGLDLRGGGHGPGRVNTVTEGSEDADAPVAEIVANALDDDGAVIGNNGRYICLVGEEGEEVFGGLSVEVVLADEAADGGIGRKRAQFADERPDAAAEFEGASGEVAMPERHFAGAAGCGRDQNAVMGDLVDAPGRGAEEENFADAGLEDHLLVEFADTDRLFVLAGRKTP